MSDTEICPLCKQPIDSLVDPHHESVDRVVIDWIKRENPDWVESDGACPKCLELYRKMKASGGHLPSDAEGEVEG